MRLAPTLAFLKVVTGFTLGRLFQLAAVRSASHSAASFVNLWEVVNGGAPVVML